MSQEWTSRFLNHKKPKERTSGYYFTLQFAPDESCFEFLWLLFFMIAFFCFVFLLAATADQGISWVKTRISNYILVWICDRIMGSFMREPVSKNCWWIAFWRERGSYLFLVSLLSLFPALLMVQLQQQQSYHMRWWFLSSHFYPTLSQSSVRRDLMIMSGRIRWSFEFTVGEQKENHMISQNSIDGHLDHRDLGAQRLNVITSTPWKLYYFIIFRSLHHLFKYPHRAPKMAQTFRMWREIRFLRRALLMIIRQIIMISGIVIEVRREATKVIFIWREE